MFVYVIFVLPMSRYAANFNKFIAETAQDVGGFDSPQVKVCAPVGCRVLDSKIPQLTGRDSHILVFDYPATEVTKFILDGTEEFHELSQAFFHHVAWTTSGNAMLFDLKARRPRHFLDLLRLTCLKLKGYLFVVVEPSD